MGLFNKPTVDGILASFNKTVADLQALATGEREIAKGERERAIELFDSAEDREVEANRAEMIAGKILDLVTVDVFPSIDDPPTQG